MPRPPTDTVQITFRVPSHWLDEADALASTMTVAGSPATRTDAFREAMRRGFKQLEEEAKAETRYRISAYDGRNGRCLFWFGPDKQTAIATADRLAAEHADSKWTMFAVFDARKEDAGGPDAEDPIHSVLTESTPTTTTRRRR